MNTAVETSDERGAVLAVVKTVLAGLLDQDLPPLTEDTALVDDLGLDSTNVLTLLMDLEDSLRLEFDFGVLEQRHIETVGSVTDLVLATKANLT